MYNKRQSFFVKKPFFNISEAKLAILPHKNKRTSNKKLKERHPFGAPLSLTYNL